MPRRDNGNDRPVNLRPGGQQVDIPQDAAIRKGKQVEIASPSGTSTTPIYDQAYDFLDSSVVCCRGWDPILLDNFFLRALKSHFSQPDTFFHNELKDYPYKPGKEGKLNILLSTRWDPNNVETRTALVVKRGTLQSQRIVTDDVAEVDEVTGQTSYVRHLKGSHRILCSGEVDGQSDLIAYETFLFLTTYAPLIRQQLPFHAFDVVGLTEQEVMDDLGHEFRAAVQIEYLYEYGWSINQDPVPFRSIHLQPEVTLD